MLTLLEMMIACRRLPQLGYADRVDDLCLIKQFLVFRWLFYLHSDNSIKSRWRDYVRRDLKTFDINESTWYALAHDRRGWLVQYTREASLVLMQLQQDLLVCSAYTRSFR